MPKPQALASLANYLRPYAMEVIALQFPQLQRNFSANWKLARNLQEFCKQGADLDRQMNFLDATQISTLREGLRVGLNDLGTKGKVESIGWQITNLKK